MPRLAEPVISVLAGCRQALYRLAPGAVILAALPAAAQADPLATIRAAGDAGPVYAFDMVYEIGEVTATGQVDPTRPEGERITITSPAEETWTRAFAESVRELDKEADGDIWCADFASNIPSDAELAVEDGETLTYTFRPAPDAEADGTERKIFEHLLATAVIAREAPAVLSFQMHLPEPMKPNLMAKITHFSMFARCERAPDGRTYVADMTFEIAGSALGQAFEERTRQQITRLFEPANR